MEYNFSQHLHNFSVWTASRAVNRNFTTTSHIKSAIESSDLRKFAEEKKCISENEFTEFHKRCAHKLISNLNDKASYGRAAKIISIYLKTSVIITEKGESEICRFIHPPIDRILLNKIIKDNPKLKLKKRNWTLFSENDYWELITELKSIYGTVNWELEEFWNLGEDNSN